MSNSQWHEDQAAGERAMREHERQTKNDQALAAAVRAAIATGGVGSSDPSHIDNYAWELREDGSMFGAAILFAIADALRKEREP